MSSLCEDCVYAKWDCVEYYGGAKQGFVEGCKKEDTAQIEVNNFDEVTDCSAYKMYIPEEYR